MLKKNLMALAVLTAITGCKSTVQNVCPASTRVELPMSSHPMKGSSNTEVVVFAPTMKFNGESAAQVSASLDQALTRQINQTGAKVVDRSLAKKLKKEIQIAEASGRVNTSGVPIADMAIMTNIGVASFSRSFSEARSWTDKKGKRHTSPAECTFKAEVEANVKIISLPSMESLKNIELEGENLEIVETRDSRCRISREEMSAIVAKAAKRAVIQSADLQNFLAPKGAVMEMRRCESGAMVKIDIGSKHGIAPGQEVAFTSYEKVDNGNGGFEIETRGYGKGKAEIINSPEHGIKANYSWVVLENEIANKVMRGDTIKPVFEGTCDWGFFAGLCHSVKDNLKL